MTLRLRHSWTSSRQRKTARRLAREERRLHLLEEMLQEQRLLVERLRPLDQEAEFEMLFPQRESPAPPAPKPFNPAPGLTEARPRSPFPDMEPEEIDRLLGLPQQQS